MPTTAKNLVPNFPSAQLPTQKQAAQAWVHPEFFLPYTLDVKALQTILTAARPWLRCRGSRTSPTR